MNVSVNVSFCVCFFRLYVLIGNDFAGLLPPDKEAKKADTWCPKFHSLELSKDIQVVQKFLL